MDMILNPDGELTVNLDEANVVCWIFEQYLAANSLGKLLLAWKGRASPLPLADPDGTGRQLTNGSPMKSIPGGCCFTPSTLFWAPRHEQPAPSPQLETHSTPC